MIELLRREFTVQLPVEKAWQHLARLEQWPSWAKHIRKIKVEPPGELIATSKGSLHLKNGMKPEFKVTEFNPHRNWKWVGSFLWATVHYDHHFEELNPAQTKLTWVVEAEGFGISVIGRIFAKIYSKDLDKAIPALIDEMNSGRL
ncbi:MAG: SRPBCC family protein [Pirellulaceae bacterium]